LCCYLFDLYFADKILPQDKQSSWTSDWFREANLECFGSWTTWHEVL